MSGILGALVGLSASNSVSIPNLSPNEADPGGAAAILSLTNAGAYSATNDLSGNYCDPTSLAAQLEARLTRNSGDVLTGASVGTWLSLSASRSWTLLALSGQLKFTNCTLEIRESATGTVRATASVRFDADGT